MSNELQIFSYLNNKVRVIVRVIEKDGEPWFVAKDVCDILELENITNALKSLDPDDLTLTILKSGSQNREMKLISESGLYTLILRSNKPEAKNFRRWVTHEVLPSIRKRGMYATPQTVDQIIADPDSFIKILQELKAERAKATALNEQVEAQKPKVLFADAVETSKGSILIGELAKLIKQNGVDIGQNRLFEWLRNNGYLISRRGESWNMPTQWSMNRQLFEVKERTVNDPDGSIRITKTTKVTGKGQVYFINKFLAAEKQAEKQTIWIKQRSEND